jgi:hypothetical protein
MTPHTLGSVPPPPSSGAEAAGGVVSDAGAAKAADLDLVLVPSGMGGVPPAVSERRFLSCSVSLQAQIFEVVGIFTDIDDLASSSSMMIGKACAPWPMRPPIVVAVFVRVPPNFLQLWMNLTLLRLSATMMMLSGSSVRVVILSFFEVFSAIALMKAPKFLLAELASLIERRCACQLLWSCIVVYVNFL